MIERVELLAVELVVEDHHSIRMRFDDVLDDIGHLADAGRCGVEHDIVFVDLCRVQQTVDDLPGVEEAGSRHDDRNRRRLLQGQSLCDRIRLIPELFDGFLHLDAGIFSHHF